MENDLINEIPEVEKKQMNDVFDNTFPENVQENHSDKASALSYGNGSIKNRNVVSNDSSNHE